MRPEYVIPIDNRKYVYAICWCQTTTDFAIRIPKVKGQTAYRFKCDKCGLKGRVLVGDD